MQRTLVDRHGHLGLGQSPDKLLLQAVRPEPVDNLRLLFRSGPPGLLPRQGPGPAGLRLPRWSRDLWMLQKSCHGGLHRLESLEEITLRPPVR